MVDAVKSSDAAAVARTSDAAKTNQRQAGAAVRVSVPIPDSYHHTTRSIEFDTETETFTENYWDWSDPTNVSLQTLRNTLATRGAASKYFLDWYSQHASFLYPADRRLLLL